MGTGGSRRRRPADGDAGTVSPGGIDTDLSVGTICPPYDSGEAAPGSIEEISRPGANPPAIVVD